MVSKLEKGINLEDFWMFTNVVKFGKIDDKYSGDEKYRHFLPKILLVYFDYHKEILRKEQK